MHADPMLTIAVARRFDLSWDLASRAAYLGRDRESVLVFSPEAMERSTRASRVRGGITLRACPVGHRLSATRSHGTCARMIADLRAIDLAVAAEELGADGAYFRVHHFARQLASPFPLLSAVGARTKRIESGTAVIDMRYENPLYMAEDAGAADLIAGGRLQLGISRGSPEQVIDGFRYFGYQPAEGETDADMGRRHAEVFRAGGQFPCRLLPLFG